MEHLRWCRFVLFVYSCCFFAFIFKRLGNNRKVRNKWIGIFKINVKIREPFEQKLILCFEVRFCDLSN